MVIISFDLVELLKFMMDNPANYGGTLIFLVCGSGLVVAILSSLILKLTQAVSTVVMVVKQKVVLNPFEKNEKND